MGAAVQVQGLKNVLEAYDMQAIPAFSIWQNKNMIGRGLDRAELEQHLEIFSKSKSDAIYTLKTYDDIDDVKKIKERTEACCSFNFKFFDSENNSTAEYQKRVALEERIRVLEEGEDDDEDDSILGKIGNSLSALAADPDKLISVINGIPNILSGLQNLIKSPQAPAVIGHVIREFVTPETVVSNKKENSQAMPQNNNAVPLTDEQRRDKLVKALDTLEKNDPEIIEHLEKLATLSETNPQMFSFLINNLNTM